MKELSERFVRRMDHVVWKEIEGKGILLNLETGSYFEVDPVGLEIWQRCDGKTTCVKIVETIAELFDANPDRVNRDLKDFIGEMKRLKIAEVLDEPQETAATIS